jgi:hypothetical protein
MIEVYTEMMESEGSESSEGYTEARWYSEQNSM